MTELLMKGGRQSVKNKLTLFAVDKEYRANGINEKY